MATKSNTTSRSPERRVYRSPLREAQAKETRRKIVQAAVACFSQYGYSRSTLALIGREAEVSAESVAAHGPKAALLIAAFEYAFTGQEGADPVAAREDIERIFAIEDTNEMARAYADFSVSVHGKGIDMWRAVQDGAAQDESVAELYRSLMERRLRDNRTIVRLLADRGIVRRDQPEEITAGTLALISSFDPYQLYVRDFGWSEQQLTDWFVEVFRRNVLSS
ncbi:TetR/AcrR family transcriptional regulator [Microbacterium testaceum]|jgi:AcrR family transcriptional regulator|nr:TetR/AcrR family transcriptional regulator [Microbacterium testaceum]